MYGNTQLSHTIRASLCEQIELRHVAARQRLTLLGTDLREIMVLLSGNATVRWT